MIGERWGGGSEIPYKYIFYALRVNFDFKSDLYLIRETHLSFNLTVASYNLYGHLYEMISKKI